MNESVLSKLTRLDLGRMKSYKELLDFYYGRQWEGKARWHERRLTFNYAKVFIEKVTSYLMGDINFAVDPYDDSDEAREAAKRAELALKRVYTENSLEQLDLETEIDCAVLGDGAYKIIWDAEEKRVRITAPDVQGIYAWYAGDDMSRLWRIASRYQLSQEEVELLYDRLRHIDDRNLTTTTQGYQRGAALLRKAEINAISGAVLIPVNCGQQLYDVIDFTDARAGLVEVKRRVLGMTLVYRPQRGEYLQRLELGGV